jgi:hypothetical protein
LNTVPDIEFEEDSDDVFQSESEEDSDELENEDSDDIYESESETENI